MIFLKIFIIEKHKLQNTKIIEGREMLKKNSKT